MDRRTLSILEYDKIIERLASECCSQMTREAALKLKPSRKPFWIEEELKGTEEALAVIMRKGSPPLGNFYDVSGLAHLAAKEGRLTMRQLLQISYNLNSAIQTKAFLSTDLPKLPGIDALVSAISVLDRLCDEITRCIISEDEMADSASPELHKLRRAIIRQNEAIRSKLSSIAGSSANRSFLQDAVVTMRQGRYVLPVKQEHKNRLSGIVHDQSASGATLFIEPQIIVNMNNELRELELAEQKEIQRILEGAFVLGRTRGACNKRQSGYTVQARLFICKRQACLQHESLQTRDKQRRSYSNKKRQTSAHRQQACGPYRYRAWRRL